MVKSKKHVKKESQKKQNQKGFGLQENILKWIETINSDSAKA